MQLHNDQLIKKWEQLRLEAYLPTPNDVWTIGWGHTKGVKKGQRISRTQAQTFFEEDVGWAVHAVNKNVKVGLTQNQFDTLVSFVFNIGETDFRSSTLLRKLNAGDYEGAAEQLPRWNKQKGKILRGLVRRRAEEMEWFLTPDTDYVGGVIDTVPELKSLKKSKEMIGGILALLTGAAPIMGGESLKSSVDPLVLISVALLAIGAFLVWNRLSSRKKGER